MKLASGPGVEAPGTYIDERRLPYPFCPGCGHGRILDALNAALVRTRRDPRRVVIVTDIGCVGLSDQYFLTNGLHGLHGRSVTYATGIKLADPDLTVIVLMGDGGCGIGANHLVHAARRNVGITVLVFDNFNFGMTGGQQSPLTPPGSVTSSTPAGNPEFPMDVCATVAVNGAAFAARTSAFDPALSDLIYEAITTDGFALVDIWELCTAYFVPNNRFSRQALEQALKQTGLPAGAVARRTRTEYTRALRDQAPNPGGAPIRAIEPRYKSALAGPTSIILAGAAGQKVRSAASVLGRAAVMSGLYATQRDDYPVTVMTGHSISEVIVSPQPIGYTGIPAPDVLVVLAREGVPRARRLACGMGPEGRLYVERSLVSQFSAGTKARVHVLSTERLGKRSTGLAAVALIAEQERLVPVEALEEAARDGHRGVEEEMVRAIAARKLLVQ